LTALLLLLLLQVLLSVDAVRTALFGRGTDGQLWRQCLAMYRFCTRQ
jgi:hypothetical protein